MKRVAITGIGMIDTLGNNPQDCFASFISEQYQEPTPFVDCVLEDIQHQKMFRFDLEKLELPDINQKTKKILENSILYALHATNQALEDAGVGKSKNVAVVASNVTAGDYSLFTTIKDLHDHGKMKSVKSFIAGMKDFLPGFISQQWDFHGPNIALNAACATGLFNIDYAMRFVDDYDYVVCVVSDSPANPITTSIFYQLGALGTSSKPFDDNRDGFIPGEGAGCFIIESEEKALKRKAKVHAWLHPVGFASDAFNPTAPSPEGVGAKMAMTNAMKHSSAKELAFVNAHGTSTPAGDVVEYESIIEVIGPVPTFSCKSKIGHTIGSCGIIEAIYGIYAIKSNLVLPNFNLNNCSFDQHNILHKKVLHTTKRKFLNNSFGFGGKCASQVVEVP